MTTHPVQTHYVRDGGRVSEHVTKLAYEVYVTQGGAGQSLERLNERGGFGVGELIAFLYARNFPKEQWNARCREAFHEMKLSY